MYFISKSFSCVNNRLFLTMRIYSRNWLWVILFIATCDVRMCVSYSMHNSICLPLILSHEFNLIWATLFFLQKITKCNSLLLEGTAIPVLKYRQFFFFFCACTPMYGVPPFCLGQKIKGLNHLIPWIKTALALTPTSYYNT